MVQLTEIKHAVIFKHHQSLVLRYTLDRLTPFGLQYNINCMHITLMLEIVSIAAMHGSVLLNSLFMQKSPCRWRFFIVIPLWPCTFWQPSKPYVMIGDAHKVTIPLKTHATCMLCMMSLPMCPTWVYLPAWIYIGIFNYLLGRPHMQSYWCMLWNFYSMMEVYFQTIHHPDMCLQK